MRRFRVLATAALGTTLLASGAAWASPATSGVVQPTHHPRYMGLVRGAAGSSFAVTPPAPPCPIPNGSPVGPCVKLPEFPAAGAPAVGSGELASLPQPWSDAIDSTAIDEAPRKSRIFLFIILL